MPIIVNMAGGGLDSAGQGVAAAQQYRGIEQQMRLRDQSFELEKQTALAKIDLEERDMQFQQEMLAQQQESEADALLGLAIESGVDVGDQGAYRKMLAGTSPRFRQQMAAEFGRATRMKAEQQQFEGLLARVQNTPELAEIQQQVESGQITSATQLRNAVERGERRVAETVQREADRARTMAEWEKWQADPGFDMPPDTDDAHEDVMKRLSRIIPGGGARGDVKYREVLEELKLLTNRGSREAARRIAIEEFGPVLGGNEPTTDMMLGVAKDERHADHVRLEGGIAKMDAFRRQTNEMPNELYDQETGKPVSGAASDVPGEKLKKPLEEAERAALYGAGPDADTKADVQALMQQLGMKEIPQAGTPEYVQLSAALKALKEKRAAEKPKASFGAPLREGRGGKFL